MTAPEDDKIADVNECFLSKFPWHAEGASNIFACFAEVSDLIFVSGNVLSKNTLDEIYLLHWPLVDMVCL
jgi:hypothetical protein